MSSFFTLLLCLSFLFLRILRRSHEGFLRIVNNKEWGQKLELLGRLRCKLLFRSSGDYQVSALGLVDAQGLISFLDTTTIVSPAREIFTSVFNRILIRLELQQRLESRGHVCEWIENSDVVLFIFASFATQKSCF